MSTVCHLTSLVFFISVHPLTVVSFDTDIIRNNIQVLTLCENSYCLVLLIHKIKVMHPQNNITELTFL